MATKKKSGKGSGGDGGKVASGAGRGAREDSPPQALTPALSQSTGRGSDAVAPAEQLPAASALPLTAPVALVEGEREGRFVKEWKRCPSCWGAQRGVGKVTNTSAINGTLSRRYLKCDCCGNTWTADVRTVVVKTEHKDVVASSLDGGVVDIRERALAEE